MKRDKLNEINKIKNLINLLENKDLFINEQNDDVEKCKDTLIDAGYKIYGSGLEQENIDFLEKNCRGNKNLSDVLKVLKDKGISSSNIEVGKQSNNCYVYVKSVNIIDVDEINKFNIPKISVMFYDDGDLIISDRTDNETFHENHNTITASGKDYIIWKYLIYGEYKVLNNNVITENLKIKYVIGFDENGKQKTFPLNQQKEEIQNNVQDSFGSAVNFYTTNFYNILKDLKP